MRVRSYRGKRVTPSTRPAGAEGAAQTMLRVAVFPFLFVYLELILHIYLGAPLKYIPVYFVFGVSAGLLFSTLTLAFKRRVNGILSKVLALFISLVYVVEMICKRILQSYYPLSSLGTAAENKLTDYADLIISTVLHSLPVIDGCIPDMRPRRLPPFDADFGPERDLMSADLTDTYPEGCMLSAYQRTLMTLRSDSTVRLVDAFEFMRLPQSVTFRFVTAQRPVSLGQASRIPGVSPADVAVLMVWLKRGQQ